MSDNKIKIEIAFEKSFLKTEDKIQMALKEAVCLATESAIKQYDTDGSAIEFKGNKLSSKGLVPKNTKHPIMK